MSRRKTEEVETPEVEEPVVEIETVNSDGSVEAKVDGEEETLIPADEETAEAVEEIAEPEVEEPAEEEPVEEPIEEPEPIVEKPAKKHKGDLKLFYVEGYGNVIATDEKKAKEAADAIVEKMRKS